MSQNNPFENTSTTQNPWSNEPTSTTPTGGPRFGNAYEDSGWSGRMPSPSDYRHQTRTESNKIEYSSEDQQQANVNAYEFSGTRFGNQEQHLGNAYSPVSTPTITPATPPRRPDTTETTSNKPDASSALPPVWDERRMHPSKWRLLSRFILFIAAIGHLGFAAGASPKSGQPVPFDSAACFYYLFAVAILTIIWTVFHMGYYLFRRFAKYTKMKRPLMLGIDLLLAILWGIGVIVEVAKYHCSPGGYDGWCDFYNVSIFFGFVCFAGFIGEVAWDSVGGCITHKR
ncbi:uncharacterized protein BX664DRAFT_279798 [Halteromyces radiatus]|uniref:uncharacterized protein n=1 Tax=Halteromyces radiatus TaxID=101107 RepID=UPI00221F134B|nr:uncharacterized protein BX664DRAFT_279798 [Halteromyces radiatus]KAI8089078.1 hypothetical protein BX664DRAFT_279798 [Halteromyces radiatus]